jgi:hypothetical protein
MRYLLTLLGVIALLVQNVSATERPNLVMIFTDDQRYDAVGYAGNDAVHTPNLDRLAQQVSGQYPGRHGIDDFHKTFTPEQLRRTVPARLRDAGYQTAFFGKWGIGDSPKRTHQGAAVFDYWAGQPMQTCFFHESDCRYVRFNGFDRPLDDLCDCPADASGRLGYRNRVGKANLQAPLHVDAEIAPMHVERFLERPSPTRIVSPR